jgi:ABC-2 type transport system permease protein
MTMIAVLIFVLANGIFPDWSWLEALPIYALVTIFAAGVGMLLSSTYVRYRDVQPIWEVTAQLLFYATPVLYVSSKIPETARHFLLCNPLAAALAQLRTAVVDPSAPSLGTEMGNNLLVLVPVAIALGTFALGFEVFRRASPRIAENL